MRRPAPPTLPALRHPILAYARLALPYWRSAPGKWKVWSASVLLLALTLAQVAPARDAGGADGVVGAVGAAVLHAARVQADRLHPARARAAGGAARAGARAARTPVADRAAVDAGVRGADRLRGLEEPAFGRRHRGDAARAARWRRHRRAGRRPVQRPDLRRPARRRAGREPMGRPRHRPTRQLAQGAGRRRRVRSGPRAPTPVADRQARRADLPRPPGVAGRAPRAEACDRGRSRRARGPGGPLRAAVACAAQGLRRAFAMRLHRHSRAFVRYSFVGSIATAAHYGLLTALVELAHWPAPPAAGLGAMLGAQVAFAGNRWFTFAHRGPWVAAWWRFQATAVLGAIVSMVTVAIGVQIGLHYLVAQVAGTLLSLLLTFTVNRRWSFGDRPAA